MQSRHQRQQKAQEVLKVQKRDQESRQTAASPLYVPHRRQQGIAGDQWGSSGLLLGPVPSDSSPDGTVAQTAFEAIHCLPASYFRMLCLQGKLVAF